MWDQRNNVSWRGTVLSQRYHQDSGSIPANRTHKAKFRTNTIFRTNDQRNENQSYGNVCLKGLRLRISISARRRRAVKPFPIKREVVVHTSEITTRANQHARKLGVYAVYDSLETVFCLNLTCKCMTFRRSRSFGYIETHFQSSVSTFPAVLRTIVFLASKRARHKGKLNYKE